MLGEGCWVQRSQPLQATTQITGLSKGGASPESVHMHGNAAAYVGSTMNLLIFTFLAGPLGSAAPTKTKQH